MPASLARNGWHFEIETDDDSTGGHFLYLHHGAPPKPFHVRAMHASLNLRAGHEFYKTIMRDGGTYNMIERMQTRTKLHATIGLHDYEAFDASIVRIILPEAMPQF